MQVTYDWTPALLAKALRLHRRGWKSRWYGRFALLVLLDGAALAFTGMWLYSKIKLDEKTAQGIVTIAILFVIYAILAHLYPWYITRRSWKNMFPTHITVRKVTVQIADSAIEYTLPTLSEARIDWSVICKVVSNRELTLLYMTKRSFIAVPRWLLTESDLQELEALTASKVTKTKC
jgi:hypothetical protein